jgi:polyisoprenyl-teichoic acid--peptidoglycan teichoic acid transferase
MRQDQPRKPRYRIRWKRLLLVCFMFVVCIGLAAAGVLYYYLDSFQSRTTSGGDPQVTESKTYAQVGGRVNILALGVDDGEYGAKEQQPKRSDTLMLISIDPATNSANILSIPRDTAVNIPSRKGTEKIAHAHAYGGPDLAVRTVSQLLGVPIQYYVEADFEGFEEIVDVLGGVDLYVEHNMKYEDPYANLEINLRQGFQHLNGDKAGQYVRFRHDELGDIGRVQRQQKFVQAVADKVMQPSTVLKIPTLAGTIKQYVRTDMSAVQMLRVANAVKGLKRENIRTEMLPGNFGDINNVSYWVVDKEETKRLVQKMFRDPGKKWADSNDTTNRTNSM